MSDNHFIPVPQEDSQQASKKPLKMATGDTFRVRRYDSMNWVLELFVTGQMNPFTGEPGRDKWTIYGYYGQLADVARHLINQGITFADGTSGQQVLDAIEQVEKSVTLALTEAL